jgi:predicted RND superfamily exporter protein
VSVASSLTTYATEHPRTVYAAVLVLTLALGALIPRIQIDTDPENMLPADQPERLFHRSVKADFALYDFLVVGLVNEEHPDGVYNPETLARLHRLTRTAQETEGVVAHEVLSLATVDDVRSEGAGTVRFDWMMRDAPTSAAEAARIREATARQPMLRGTLVSEDDRAAALYVPLVDKAASHDVAAALRAEADQMGLGGDDLHLTGLPVAEETFGIEMFLQMGVAAPMAGLVVFFMLWVFFRSGWLITSPMIVAMATVIATMGLLIGLGFPVHIMSSMIPIFLMPIAVVDSVHILSEFADRYRATGDREGALRHTMEELFTPMLYTSLTSAVGFASLAFAPIPPVRVFGLFVAFGILLAFALTIVFIPAYVSRMSEAGLAKLQLAAEGQEDGDASPLGRALARLGRRTVGRSKVLLGVAALLVAFGAAGIAQIVINDNPVRWFRPSHEIRVADRVLNAHFGGTYDAYLILRQTGDGAPAASPLTSADAAVATSSLSTVTPAWDAMKRDNANDPDGLLDAAYDRLDAADTDAEAQVWEGVVEALEGAGSRGTGLFRDPEALAYVEQLQAALLATEHVGKSNALPDIVKTVHRSLYDDEDAQYVIPASTGGVAQTLLSYQSSHRPNDLWHFVTPDYRAANVWVQLKSGDNRDMAAVTDAVDRFVAENPPPAGVEVEWAGLTYLNVVWQEAMVEGMLKALLGSFGIVFVMMLLLFRSVKLGLLAMLPLTVTIVLLYGLIGWAGKDYDMPIAVLSSLTLGLSIDFAIHFIQRARTLIAETGSWAAARPMLFAEPARAITRNAFVIAVGFLPLLLSPLVPYNTVGIFLATIMAVSCLATLLLIPAALDLTRRRASADVPQTA